MRDKLIELLLEVDSVCEVGECCECVIEACYIHRAADHLISNGVTFAEDNNVSCKWIPVTERLPGKEGVYIVRSDAGSVYTSHFYSEKTFASGYCRPSMWTPRGKTKVTHWMPLPELPKGSDI